MSLSTLFSLLKEITLYWIYSSSMCAIHPYYSHTSTTRSYWNSSFLSDFGVAFLPLSLLLVGCMCNSRKEFSELWAVYQGLPSQERFLSHWTPIKHHQSLSVGWITWAITNFMMKLWHVQTFLDFKIAMISWVYCFFLVQNIRFLSLHQFYLDYNATHYMFSSTFNKLLSTKQHSGKVIAKYIIMYSSLPATLQFSNPIPLDICSESIK